MTTHYVLDFKGNRIASRLYSIVIRWVTKQMSRYAKKIICVNKEYPAIYASWGIDARKIVYIPNGIDTNKFSPGDSDIKQKLDCRYLVIYWGRLGYQKNVALLIQAFMQLKTPGAKLVIVGKGPDLPKLQALASSDQRIIFPGYLPDEELVRYARGADLAVLPSRGESWGLVIGEAMGCGLPVISSDVGMAHELLGDHRGVLLKNDSVEELTQSMEYCLKNKTKAQEMGKHARAFIVNRYSWEEVAKQIDALYQSCINGKDMV
jgi:glycosyltransferase involved in cell wall biosynthesis